MRSTPCETSEEELSDPQTGFFVRSRVVARPETGQNLFLNLTKTRQSAKAARPMYDDFGGFNILIGN
jgi:hypothetical protein